MDADLLVGMARGVDGLRVLDDALEGLGLDLGVRQRYLLMLGPRDTVVASFVGESSEM